MKNRKHDDTREIRLPSGRYFFWLSAEKNEERRKREFSLEWQEVSLSVLFKRHIMAFDFG